MKKTTTILIIMLVLVVSLSTALWINNRSKTAVPDTRTPDATVQISSQTISEENFTGSRPVITGTVPVVAAANQYVDSAVADFKRSADEQVPQMRAQFGNDAPPAHYTIDLGATYVSGAKAESVVIDGYFYTGGANGMSTYQVFTAEKGAPSLLSLRDVVRDDQQEAFTAFVKNEILKRQEAVFEDAVSALTFDSFKNFSLDDTNLTLYFSKYDIGPGALGPVAFPLPLASIQQYLTAGY